MIVLSHGLSTLFPFLNLMVKKGKNKDSPDSYLDENEEFERQRIVATAYFLLAYFILSDLSKYSDLKECTMIYFYNQVYHYMYICL